MKLQSISQVTLGTDFGPYKIVRILGAGAFGAVFEAKKQPLDKRVAIKILHPRWSENPHVTERFLQEARAAASLRHPHIVDIDDIGARDGIPWIAMEFLAGESLAARLQRERRLPVETALEYMLPILSAVATVHEHGIIHRDLKPDNIQLWQSTPGTIHPKLLDFGIAKLSADPSERSLTGATDIMGTPEYMAPEQWRSAKNVGPASDQWALAVILYRLLTGISPFVADSAQSIMFRCSMEPLAPFPPELSKLVAVEAILRKALSKEASNRFETVRDFGQALLPFAAMGVQERWRSEFAPTQIMTASELKRVHEEAPTMAESAAPPAQANASDSIFTTSKDIVLPQKRSAPMLAAAAIGALVLVGGLGFAARGLFRNPPVAVPQPTSHTTVSAEPTVVHVPSVSQLSQPSQPSTPSVNAVNSQTNPVANPATNPALNPSVNIVTDAAVAAQTPTVERPTHPTVSRPTTHPTTPNTPTVRVNSGQTTSPRHRPYTLTTPNI